MKMAAAEKNWFQEAESKKQIELMESDTRNFQISLGDQIRLMHTSDIAVADNYWEGTMPITKRKRSYRLIEKYFYEVSMDYGRFGDCRMPNE